MQKIKQDPKHLHGEDRTTLKNIRILEEQFPWLWAIRSSWARSESEFSIHVQKITAHFLSSAPSLSKRKLPNGSLIRTEYWVKVRHVNWLMVAVDRLNTDAAPTVAEAVTHYIAAFVKSEVYAPIVDFVVEVTTTVPFKLGATVEQVEIYKPDGKDCDVRDLCWKLTEKK